MQIHIFISKSRSTLHNSDEAEIKFTMLNIAQNTETQNLVVALYLMPCSNHNCGTAYVRKWITPTGFIAKRGKWKISQKWPCPTDLPREFKLIRIRIDNHPEHYPKDELDIYGWQFRYDTFKDHLATLFAHELHHFRRYHLGMHPREGEHTSNRWALQKVQNMGYKVSASRTKKIIKNKSIYTTWLKKLPYLDPYTSFRKLKKGDSHTVKHDPNGHYLGHKVTVLRSIRPNSKRIVIETIDGKTWRWPMNWLKLGDP